ncbi:MAG: nucleotidyltransferase domain-containing protein [Marinilabiliales bacterium]|nr:MAG: nucleotidyltransferase domain-containing protein [Marinilabiliales bacterium]
MDKAINKTITEYIKLIQQEYPDFESVYVFGSYARGNSNLDSDIDLALIFRDLDDSKRFDIQVQLMLLASQIDTRIEPHPISHNDFYSDNPFVDEIKRTGFEIFAKATS